MNKKPWYKEDDLIVFTLAFIVVVAILSLISYVELWLK